MAVNKPVGDNARRGVLKSLGTIRYARSMELHRAFNHGVTARHCFPVTQLRPVVFARREKPRWTGETDPRQTA